MSLTDVVLSATGLPTGTWRLDPTHSSAGFAVKHMAVSTFRGRFEKFDATLTVGQDWAELVGVVDAGSLRGRQRRQADRRARARPELMTMQVLGVAGSPGRASTWSSKG